MDYEKMRGICYENTLKSWFESSFRMFVVKINQTLFRALKLIVYTD